MEHRGAIAWYARNPVAANLLMLMLLLGGLFATCNIRQEVFPDFQLDVIRVSVPYPGASPAEVEEGISEAIEEAVRGVNGVDRVTSASVEGAATIHLSLDLEADATTVLADVKNEVDRLTSLPKDSLRPTVSLVTNRVEVISLVIHGEQDVEVLRALAENMREDLLSDPEITNVKLSGAPPREISIEVSQDQLRNHGLTLEEIAGRIASTALDLPGGTVKTGAGEVALRTTERRHSGQDFANVPVVTSQTGTELRLGQIAKVLDTYEETDQESLFNGEPAIMLKVYRTGDQTPIEIAEKVRTYVDKAIGELPEGVSISTWVDWSVIYSQRIDLLMRNAFYGLTLVLLLLGVFLELRVAFWVTMGIPVSFLGAILLMPAVDVSLNMVSLFAFIVTLGMVVDDAIVVGENIFEMRQRGVPPLEAAIRGAKGVAVPVTFSIATSVVAFAPMLFVPGFSGKLYRVIPTIVIAVLIISLVESVWVLPAHLAAIRDPGDKGFYAAIFRQQQKLKRALEWFITRAYAPVLRLTLKRRYLALCIGVATLVVAGGFVGGGHIGFRFMPHIDGDVAIGAVELPYGTSIEETRRIQAKVLKAANELIEENGEEGIVRGIYSSIGTPLPGDPGVASVSVGGGHLTNVSVFFVDSSSRELATSDFLQSWRERVGRVAGAEKLSFVASIGPSPGPPISVELIHDDMKVLEAASSELAEQMRNVAGVWDIDDGFSGGKPQLDMRLTPEATAVGLTSAMLAQQVRAAFYGAEALRQQEERDEVRVMVRLPRDERRTIHDVESLLIRTPQGGEIPLRDAAEIVSGRSLPVIQRAEGHRQVEVTAELRDGVANPAAVMGLLADGPLRGLMDKYPGLRFEFGGSQREQQKAMDSLSTGAALALIVVFALLAIPFRSYMQPLIVMTAIPFGVVGAIIGHAVMGFDLSMISVMGLVALTGVVVNDSLVLIDAANIYRREGNSPIAAIEAAGIRRFRPILLTSLTTFFGLMPMITETSVQAKFLIPMAVSLGFGVLFATFIILLLVPALYMSLDDVVRIVSRPSASKPERAGPVPTALSHETAE